MRAGPEKLREPWGQVGASQEMVAAVVAATDRVFGAGRPTGRRRKLADRAGSDASFDGDSDED